MPIQNSFQSVALEPQNQTNHLKKVWLNNIKNKSTVVFDSFVKNISEIFTLMVLVYFLFLICNIILYNFQFQTVQPLSNQYSLNPLQTLGSNFNMQQASITKSLPESSQFSKIVNSQTSTQSKITQTILFQSGVAEKSLATFQSNLRTNQRTEPLIAPGIIESKEIREENQAIFQKSIEQLKQNQVKNQIKQTQISQTLKEQIKNVIKQKYGHILYQFETDEDLTEKKIELKNKKNKINNARSLQFLPNTQRQILVKNYLKNQIDPKSYYLSSSTQNQKTAQNQSEMDQKIKTHLVKKYDMDDYQEINPLCIVVTTYNNAYEQQIIRTLNSILNQQYSDYRVKVVDRFSTDQTGQLIQNYIKDFPQFGKKVELIKNKKASEIEAAFQALQYCQAGTIAILMNGNSQLLSRQAFSIIDHKFQTERIQLLYSDTYELDLSKKVITRSKWSVYDESQRFMNLYRDIPKRYGSFLTFNTQLLQHLNKNSLIDSYGEWFKYSSNDALKVSLLELSCSQNIHLKQPIFLNQFESELTQAQKNGEISQLQAISRKNKYNLC